MRDRDMSLLNPCGSVGRNDKGRIAKRSKFFPFRSCHPDNDAPLAPSGHDRIDHIFRLAARTDRDQAVSFAGQCFDLASKYSAEAVIVCDCRESGCIGSQGYGRQGLPRKRLPRATRVLLAIRLWTLRPPAMA